MQTNAARLIIDTAWHPLADGCPPEWASGWGQDPYGVFIDFTVGEINLDEVTQRLRWIPPGRFLMGSPDEETRGLAPEDHEQQWFDREHPRPRSAAADRGPMGARLSGTDRDRAVHRGYRS